MHKVPIVTGPTASGKSGLLYQLYSAGVKFELVSADAFQVYRGLDIGTAKPSIELQKHIPHHLVDVVDADGVYDTGDFIEQAEPMIADILSRGKLPIVVGGTGLYIQSLRDGLFQAPPANSEIRSKIRIRAEQEGNAGLYAELQNIDPVYAAKIHENDLVRITRALEVYMITGLPISKAHEVYRRQPRFQYDIMVVDKLRELLYADINLRVVDMMNNGWQDEVQRLLSNKITTDMPSFRAIGYREIAETITGVRTLENAIELIAQKTRNYAKRQLTWFRGMGDVRFMDADAIKEAIMTCYTNNKNQG